MAQHNELGKYGEEIARSYLVNRGYKILEQNWRFERKEVDLIIRSENTIAIVEVKIRKTDYFGNPEESVGRAKQKLLIDAANEYMQKMPEECEVRFDIIAIVMKNNKPSINHIEDAFIPLLD